MNRRFVLPFACALSAFLLSGVGALPWAEAEQEQKDIDKAGMKITGTLSEDSVPNKLGRPAHTHTVKLTANQSYTFIVRSSAFDTYLTLSQGGKVLAFDDDGGGGLNSKITFRAATTGEYQVEISSFNRKLGMYELVITPEEAGKEPKDETEVTIKNALTKESPVNTLGRPARVHDVKLAANRTYAITVRSAAFDTFLALTLDGKVLATDDDGGGGRNSKIVYRAAAAGNYRVEVSSFDRKLGDYELAIRPTTETPGVKPPIDGGPKILPPLIVGETLVPGEKPEVVKNAFRFPAPKGGPPGRPLKNEMRHPINLTAGKTYSFYVESYHFGPEVAVISPGGQPVFVDNADSDTTFAVIQYQAPASGRFLIGIRSSEPGPYQLRYRQGTLSKDEVDLDQARKQAVLGRKRLATGQYGAAKVALLTSLDAYQRTFSKKEHPDGHPDLARALAEAGHAEALTGDIKAGLAHSEEANGMYTRTVKNKGLWLATNHGGQTLLAVGRTYRAAGDYHKAIAFIVHSLNQWKLLPVDNRRNAAFFLELASLNEQLGQDRYALNSYQQAASLLQIQLTSQEMVFEKGNATAHLGRMWAKLGETQKGLDMLTDGYKKMIAGNPPPRAETLQAALALADLQEALGADTKEGNFRKIAATMARKLFSKEDFPDSHPLLATALEALGQTKLRAGDPGALDDLVEANGLFRAYYSTARFPNGHADLARSYDRLGMAYAARGDRAKGLPLVEKAYAMRESVFKAKLTQRGHPDLVTSLAHLSLLQEPGKRADALSHSARAWAMRNTLAREVLLQSTEASALAFLTTQTRCKDIVLSLTADDPSSTPGVYTELWHEKSLFTRLLERRRQALRVAVEGKDSQAGVYWKKLQEVRQEIHVFLFHDDTFAGDRAAKLKELTASKEFYERHLASIPAVADITKTAAEPTWQDLGKALPEGAVFLDFVRYQKVSQGEFGAAQYAAFILSAGGAIVRVELGNAKAIDDAIVRWRRAIEAGEISLAYVKDRGIKRVEPATKEKESVAVLLSELLWRPIASKLPAQTKRFWIAPDGDLVRVPFAALPNAKADGVLLEDYLFAQVPHGPFLVSHLTDKRGQTAKEMALLTVGGVEYGEGWPFLEGAKREVEQINRLANSKLTTTLAGKEATPPRLALELPKARIAHLATHGYFSESLLADERARADAQLKGWKFASSAHAARQTVGTRHPLVYTGLALSGANDKNAQGVLTAEAIVDLRLEGMRLAVLSACETGLGEFTQGEGVQGLPRAFHIAGCANVVVSLWKVNDTATAALMTKFYHELLIGQKTPLEALRVAQLTIYRRPDLIPQLAGERGQAEQAAALRLSESSSSETHRAATRLWAPFFLSGTGD